MSSATVVWRVGLHLSAPEIRRVDVVSALLDMSGHFADLSAVSDTLRVVLAELYSNAVEHGLLGLASPLKSETDGMEIYYAERAVRLAALVAGEIDISLEQLAHDGSDWLRVVCRDSGAGFSQAALPVAGGAVSELPFGRGLTLLRAMSAALVFNAVGNEATVVLRLAAGDLA